MEYQTEEHGYVKDLTDKLYKRNLQAAEALVITSKLQIAYHLYTLTYGYN
jgi:hypothetical protein